MCIGGVAQAVVVRIVFTADLERMLAGADGGLWHAVQLGLWVVFGVFSVVILVDVLLALLWWRRDRSPSAKTAVKTSSSAAAAAAAASRERPQDSPQEQSQQHETSSRCSSARDRELPVVHVSEWVDGGSGGWL